MRRSEFRLSFRSFLVAFALLGGPSTPSYAADGRNFIIGSSDGYGIQDCLAEPGECGRAVADAWCQAHGHSAALSFGKADDVITGSISKTAAARSEPVAYFVTCSD